MDKLKITKTNFDEEEVSIDLVAETNEVRIEIDTFEFKCQIKAFAEKICDYARDPKKECDAELLHFRMKIAPMCKKGGVVFEMEIDISEFEIGYGEYFADKSQAEKTHKCSFYMLTDIQSIDDFGRRMKGIIDGDIGYEVTL